MPMKYLVITGTSGSGKTSLGKNLTKAYPDKYVRITQNTTRDMRPNEVQHVDYHFLTDQEFNDRIDGMIAVVREQYFPHRYGTLISELDHNKVNIVAASIEGVLDLLNKVKPEDEVDIFFINNVQKPEADRNRDFELEQRYTSLVLHKITDKLIKFNLIEINHEDFKEIRNDQSKIIDYINSKK